MNSEKEFEEKYLLKKQDYGELYPYVILDTVTDINWNGHQLWIDDIEKGRYLEPKILSDEFVERFASLLSNISSAPYSRMSPVLEVETNELRISIVHTSVANTGVTISIRKIPLFRRLNKREMIRTGYCTEEINSFLRNCIKAKCNIAVCGMPGAGKTELLKYLTKYIKPSERAITIEDTLEIHYQSINPEKDCVEFKVNEKSFTYTKAIKTCLRQLPKWILLSEARSIEVRYLLECLSTGSCGLTTLHTDDVRNIPDRIKNMANATNDSERILNDTFSLINIGVLIKCVSDGDHGIHRIIDQICIFDRSGEHAETYKNSVHMVVNEGRICPDFDISKIPTIVKRKMKSSGIKDPFHRESLKQHKTKGDES